MIVERVLQRKEGEIYELIRLGRLIKFLESIMTKLERDLIAVDQHCRFRI